MTGQGQYESRHAAGKKSVDTLVFRIFDPTGQPSVSSGKQKDTFFCEFVAFSRIETYLFESGSAREIML